RGPVGKIAQAQAVGGVGVGAEDLAEVVEIEKRQQAVHAAAGFAGEVVGAAAHQRALFGGDEAVAPVIEIQRDAIISGAVVNVRGDLGEIGISHAAVVVHVVFHVHHVGRGGVVRWRPEPAGGRVVG